MGILITILFVVGISDIEAAYDRAKMTGDIQNCRILSLKLDALSPSTLSNLILVPTVHCMHNPSIQNRGWGTDITVDSVYLYHSISGDVRTDSVMFIAASYQGYFGDTAKVRILSSTDGGLHWAWFATLGGNGYGYNLYNPSMRIVETDDDDYLFVVFEAYPVTNPTDGFIGIWRLNFNSLADSSYFVSNHAGINEHQPCLVDDRIQYPYAPYLYCSWTENDSIFFARSLSRGRTWSDRKCLATGVGAVRYSNPSCAYGWYDAESLSLCLGWIQTNITTNRKRVYYTTNWGFGNDFAWRPSPVSFNPASNCIESTLTVAATPYVHSLVIAFIRVDTLRHISKMTYKYTYSISIPWAEGILDSSNTGYLKCILVADDTCDKYHLLFNEYKRSYFTEARYDNLYQSAWSTPAPINDDTLEIPIDVTGFVSNRMMGAAWVIQESGQQMIKFDSPWATCDEGVNESSKKPITINAYPNPARSVAYYNYPGLFKETRMVVLYDRAGRAVRRNQQHGGEPTSLDIVGLQTGVYFAVINSVKDKIIVKIVVAGD